MDRPAARPSAASLAPPFQIENVLPSPVADQTAACLVDVAETCAMRLLQHGIFSNISHELLTPLTAIRGYLSLLVQGQLGTLDPEQEAAVHVALSNTDRLHSMIGDLLDYASITRDRLVLAREPVELAEVVTGAVQRASTAATARQVQLAARVSATVGVVQGDRRRLARLVEHLLDNAIKFSAAGQQVSVTLGRSGGQARLVVRDAGVGMSAEILRHAEFPFIQEEHGLARQYTGIGIGLPLAQKLVTLHGGQLRIRSVRNRGTTVTVLLPLRLQ
jgi:signal transduction histidine kinase